MTCQTSQANGLKKKCIWIKSCDKAGSLAVVKELKYSHKICHALSVIFIEESLQALLIRLNKSQD